MSAEKAPQRRYAPPSFAHLRRLTDDTGLLEHALGRIPRRVEGYTTDDNCRALWTVTEWLASEALDAEERGKLTGLAEIYLAFLLWNQHEDGWWHNNVAYDRTPEAEEFSGNHDCQGRSIWAVADAWVRLKSPLRDTARVMLERALATLDEIDSIRGQAFGMAAAAHLLDAADHGIIDLPEDNRLHLTAYLKRIERVMNEEFRSVSDDNWQWFEPAMTYSNGTLPWALLRAYRVTGEAETLKNGLNSLSFLLEIMTAEEGWLRPIGNQGWGLPGQVSQWDQQPLEMFKLALALEEAAMAVEHAGKVSAEQTAKPEALLVSTAAWRKNAGRDAGLMEWSSVSPARKGSAGGSSAGQTAHFRAMRDLCLSWFYGENDKQRPLIDPADGSCCDGLNKNGPNINCGAESTISYLMTEALCRKV
jgi:hypothetical protein